MKIFESQPNQSERFFVRVFSFAQKRDSTTSVRVKKRNARMRKGAGETSESERWSEDLSKNYSDMKLIPGTRLRQRNQFKKPLPRLSALPHSRGARFARRERQARVGNERGRRFDAQRENEEGDGKERKIKKKKKSGRNTFGLVNFQVICPSIALNLF